MVDQSIFPTTLLVYRSASYPQGMTSEYGLGGKAIDTFEYDFEIYLKFTKYLKEKCWQGYEYNYLKYLTKNALLLAASGLFIPGDLLDIRAIWNHDIFYNNLGITHKFTIYL